VPENQMKKINNVLWD